MENQNLAGEILASVQETIKGEVFYPGEMQQRDKNLKAYKLLVACKKYAQAYASSYLKLKPIQLINRVKADLNQPYASTERSWFREFLNQ